MKSFDEIKIFKIVNKDGIEVFITNFGASILGINIPTKNQGLVDVLLGYNSLEECVSITNSAYFGATVGRFANRIANGKFSLDGKEYSLARNNFPNHLHGGTIGFDKVIWEYKIVDEQNSIEMEYLAKDGEEGYPGNLNIFVKFTLTEDNAIKIDYILKTDKPTPINLTNHSYFNLNGEGTILDHELMISANSFLPVNQNLIPTGKMMIVEDTPFDFRKPKKIGIDITKNDEQLKYGSGYDHNFILNKSNKGNIELVARVYSEKTGILMEVLTSEPGLQFYSGNFLNENIIGKLGKKYTKHSGFCLETQHFPDSPNQPSFPNTILRPGEEYTSTTAYRFFL